MANLKFLSLFDIYHSIKHRHYADETSIDVELQKILLSSSIESFYIEAQIVRYTTRRYLPAYIESIF